MTNVNAGPMHMGTTEWPLTGWEAVPRTTLKQLRLRLNAPGLVYLAAHLATLLCTGTLVYLAMDTWAVVPAMFLHGVVIVLLFAPLHECSHFTAFRSRWLNYAVGMFAGVLNMRPFLYFKWRHAEHHTYTQAAERDPDIVRFPRSLSKYAALILGAEFWPKMLGTLWRGTTGRFNERELRFIPESDLGRVSLEIRLVVVLYAGVAIASLAAHSWAPVLYWLLPRFMGEPVLRAIRMAEHTGAEESPDLLKNTRTTLTHPLLRMLYWNMPFHTEHHLATSVPFHALARLHDEMRPQLTNVTIGYCRVHSTIVRRILTTRRVARERIAGGPGGA